MYKPDLSPARGFDEYSCLGTVNVGWLDPAHPYTQGDTSEEFQDRLFEFCTHLVLQTRGCHQCPYCGDPTSLLAVREERHGRELYLGTAEIRVTYQGKSYAAPNLVYHYVVAHNYKPPEEFIEAVLNGPLPDTREYKEYMKKFLKCKSKGAQSHLNLC
jgi:hypothetical protein